MITFDGCPLGLCFGRIANFINGELYGRKTSVLGPLNFQRKYGIQILPPNNLSREDLRDSLSSYDLNYNSSNPLIGENNVVIEAQTAMKGNSNDRREYLARASIPNLSGIAEGLGLFTILMIIREKELKLSHGILTGTFFIGYAIFRIIGECFRELLMVILECSLGAILLHFYD